MLRAPQIKNLVEAGALQLSLFDEQNLVEISSPDFPGERLVCCRNPVLAADRTRTRDELLAATEKDLAKIAAATRRDKRPWRGKDTIALRVGKVINHYTWPSLPHRDHRGLVHVLPQRASHGRRGPGQHGVYAPACPPTPSPTTMSCCATRDLTTSNGSSAP